MRTSVFVVYDHLEINGYIEQTKRRTWKKPNFFESILRLHKMSSIEPLSDKYDSSVNSNNSWYVATHSVESLSNLNTQLDHPTKI